MNRKFYLLTIIVIVLLGFAGCSRDSSKASKSDPKDDAAAGSAPTPAPTTPPASDDATKADATAQPQPPPATRPAPAPTTGPTSADAPKAAAAAEPAPAPAPAPPPPPPPLVIPAGTVLAVHLQQAIGSKTNQAGDRFEATLAEPVVLEDEVVVPKGASAYGSVTEAKSAGRFKGGASLNLELDRLEIQGKPVPIETAVLAQAAKGKGKRTGALVGGGAAAGAIVGGLAGGGKGAAIGAAVGAGAGTAGAAFTGDRDINLPAETVVSFQLTKALRVKR
ncbi:MAG: hypothetical protein ACRD5G_17000 [Candidatus Acidiferrales bacterium]